MGYSRLEASDDERDQHDSAYSSVAVEIISGAYSAIRANDFDTAETLIQPLIGVQMAPMQRARILYIRALIACHRSNDRETLQYVDEALDIALTLEELGAVASLTRLGALALHNMQQFDSSAQYYAIALDAINTQEEMGTADPLAHFDVLDGLASASFLLGNYAESQRYLRAARRIPLPGVKHEKRAAGLEWTWSLLAQWRNDHYRALEHASAAMRVYMEHGHPIEQARLSSRFADILLDLALSPLMLDSTPIERNTLPRDRLLTMIEPHILRALGTSVAQHDRAGEGIALLMYARFQLASGHSDDSLVAIATSESIAIQLHDAPLLAQTTTIRGETFLARGEHDAALSSFAATLDILRKSDAKAYTMRARRAILVDREMRSEG